MVESEGSKKRFPILNMFHRILVGPPAFASWVKPTFAGRDRFTIVIVSWNQLHHIFGDVFNLLLYRVDFLSIYHGTMMTWDIPMVRRCFKSSKFESMFLLGRYLRSYNFCSSLFFFRKCLPGQVWKGFTSIHILIYNL